MKFCVTALQLIRQYLHSQPSLKMGYLLEVKPSSKISWLEQTQRYHMVSLEFMIPSFLLGQSRQNNQTIAFFEQRMT
ncbi:hypothetical protein GCM10009647_052230 [Streptomyces sanglieri]